MPMSRQQKETQLEQLDQVLEQAKGVVFVNYQGLKVKEFDKLRGQLTAEAMSVKVTKNTVLRLAARRHGIELTEEVTSQPLAMIASPTDEIMPAKITKAFGKEHEALKLIGGIVGNRFLSAADIRTLADLPSRDQLRAQLVGVLAAPLTGLVRTLQAPLAGLVSVLKQYETSKS